jgi:hypothetical protein
VWLNFLFLMAVVFLPFPTSLLGEYSEEQVSVVIYALNAAVASLLLSAISWYAARGHRLVTPRPGRGGEDPASAGPGGACGFLTLHRGLLPQPHGGDVLLAAPVRHRPPRPSAAVTLVVSKYGAL